MVNLETAGTRGEKEKINFRSRELEQESIVLFVLRGSRFQQFDIPVIQDEVPGRE